MTTPQVPIERLRPSNVRDLWAVWKARATCYRDEGRDDIAEVIDRVLADVSRAAAERIPPATQVAVRRALYAMQEARTTTENWKRAGFTTGSEFEKYQRALEDYDLIISVLKNLLDLAE